MVTEQRLVAIKQQALKSIASRANNPHAPGISQVAISPHEALAMIEAYIKVNADVEPQDQQ